MQEIALMVAFIGVFAIGAFFGAYVGIKADRKTHKH
jgi:hypothetical protein